MTAPKTDERLLESLRKSAGLRITKKELEHQRISFVYGNLPNNSTITRAQVADRIREKEGC